MQFCYQKGGRAASFLSFAGEMRPSPYFFTELFETVENIEHMCYP